MHHVEEMIILTQADNFILGDVVPVHERRLMGEPCAVIGGEGHYKAGELPAILILSNQAQRRPAAEV